MLWVFLVPLRQMIQAGQDFLAVGIVGALQHVVGILFALIGGLEIPQGAIDLGLPVDDLQLLRGGQAGVHPFEMHGAAIIFQRGHVVALEHLNVTEQGDGPDQGGIEAVAGLLDFADFLAQPVLGNLVLAGFDLSLDLIQVGIQLIEDVGDAGAGLIPPVRERHGRRRRVCRFGEGVCADSRFRLVNRLNGLFNGLYRDRRIKHGRISFRPATGLLGQRRPSRGQGHRQSHAEERRPEAAPPALNPARSRAQRCPGNILITTADGDPPPAHPFTQL